MKRKILVVEDNELNMKLMSDLLENQGYEVAKAYDGVEAIEAIRQNDFNLMLLDIQLPKKSGYDVLNEIEKKIPTIVVSACCMDDEISRAKHKGCIDYITKPINISDFITKIKTHLK